MNGAGQGTDGAIDARRLGQDENFDGLRARNERIAIGAPITVRILRGDGKHGTEWQDFYLAEGTCAGRVAGRMRGANHPRRRTDGTYCPDFQGVIETADGAEVMFDWRGYGRAYPVGARQIVLTATHMAEDERYRWLNDVVCVGTGRCAFPRTGTAPIS